MSAVNVRSKATATTTTTTSRNDGDTSHNDDNACVVCFKNVEIYSIGDCDHPVCYECSTRMRVLCQQNECPICRHVLSKVLFTYEKLLYRELEAKNRSEFYSKKYQIGFCCAAIQQKFFELLDHPCPKCNTPPYRTFKGLRTHVRKQHDLHYCDICEEHLRIFTFERRCYTQGELNLHRTKGDPDNRSHRGHPLCEYCNKRYLDRDELFRHLRREHYFCHFCDADGCNEFYKDYEALADHFRREHYLCEEGNCATDQFVGAFRTDIDYKAHVANVHGKSLNKQQAKQTRTLQLEITLGPRGRTGQMEQGIANLRSRNDNAHGDYVDDLSMAANLQRQQVTIDAGNEEEFPSLSGVATGPNVSLIRPLPPSMRNRTGVAGLARTKENFPALGSNTATGSSFNVSGNPQRTLNAHNVPPVSSILKKGPNTSARGSAASTTAPANGMLIHVSNRPTSTQPTGTMSKKSNALDFPALPGIGKGKKSAKNLEEDMLPSGDGLPMSNVAAKHRTLVDDYVSVAHPSTYQKIQMVQKEQMEAEARRQAVQRSAPKLTTADFPTLGKPPPPSAPSSNFTSASWVKVGSEKKQREIDNRKTRVAPAPVLPTAKNTTNNTNKTQNGNNNGQEQKTKKDKKSKDKKNNQENAHSNQLNANSKTNGTKQKEKNNNNHNDSSNDQNPTSKSLALGTMNANGSNIAQQAIRAPPGFNGDLGAAIKPPPGFISNVTVNSVAKLPNNLTFTSSSGESYSIVPSAQSYTLPPDSTTRNQKLVDRFIEVLKSPEALEEFRQFSQQFREGGYKPEAYYRHCQAALQGSFDQVFPELLALLPDIAKQQELYLVHKQHLNMLTPAQRKSLTHLEVCNSCKQVLIAADLNSHKKLHQLKNNFPSLGSSDDSTPPKSSNAQRK